MNTDAMKLADRIEQADASMTGDLIEEAWELIAPTLPRGELSYRAERFGSFMDAHAYLDAAMTLYVELPARIPSCPRLAVAEALRQREAGEKARAEEIAEGLSEAQRKTVLAMTDEWQPARRGVFSAVAAFNLVSKGVASICALWVSGYAPGYRGCDHYSLTPLGLKVRETLMEKDG